METQHLAIASVPVQVWSGKLYEYAQALHAGTIFPELNMPFFAAESVPDADSLGNSGDLPLEERDQLMAKINGISFALDDLTLFLDTHPAQQEAISLRKQLIEERKRLLKEYDQKFYSLTKDCEGLWTQGSMPWEGVCI